MQVLFLDLKFYFSRISLHGKIFLVTAVDNSAVSVLVSVEFVLFCILGRWEIEELKENQVHGDRGLVLKSRAKHHAISAVLAKPFIFADKPLIVQ